MIPIKDKYKSFLPEPISYISGFLMYNSHIRILVEFLDLFILHCYLMWIIVFAINHLFICSQFKCQTVLFESYIGTLSGAATPGPSGPWSNGNEKLLYIPQISKTGASSLDFLMSHPGHYLGGSYPPSFGSKDLLLWLKLIKLI